MQPQFYSCDKLLPKKRWSFL